MCRAFAQVILSFVAFVFCFPLNSRVCGRRPVAISHGNSLRNPGDTNALPGTWPWVVSFQFLTQKGYKHFCTGSLISSQWVVSAAHCFVIKKYIKVEYWRVLIGATKQSKPSNDAQARSIKRLVDHKGFHQSGHNDITLVELNQPVLCNDFIQPACLPDEHMKIPVLTHCYVCGWGVMEEIASHEKYTDILQEGRVNLVSNEKCNSPKWYNMEIEEDNICAIGGGNMVDKCQGDGGSPLMCRPARSERFWVIGINSWETNCVHRDRPGVFTSTKHFHHWIQQIMKNPPKSALVPPFKPTSSSQPQLSTSNKPHLAYYHDEFGNSFTFYLLGTTPHDATVIYLTKTPPSWSELARARRTTSPAASPWRSPKTDSPQEYPTRHKMDRSMRPHRRVSKRMMPFKEKRWRLAKHLTTKQPWL